MAGASLRVFLVASLLACCLAPAAGAQDDPGFIREFLAVGNWRDLPPEQQLLGPDELPFEGLVLRGCLWTVVTAREDSFVDLNVLGPTFAETALAHVYIHSAAEQSLRLLVGSDDRAHVYLNGREVHHSVKSGVWRPDQEEVAVRLHKGWNRLLLRVESETGAFGLSARFTLPDGRPVRLKTSAGVPDEWLEREELRRRLTAEQVGELLAVLKQHVGQVDYVAWRSLKQWQDEGECLDAAYGRQRRLAAAYVEALRAVLQTLVPPVGTEDEAAERQRAAAAGRQLIQCALEGPYQLTGRTRGFLDRAEEAAGLWDMAQVATATALDAGHQAAQLDRALVEARGLLAAVGGEYLRPARLRELALRHRSAAARLMLLEPDGSPVVGADVSVEQVDHEFLFGCNLFAFGRFGSPEEEGRYEERFLRLFNLAVVPVYWPLLEAAEGRADYTRDARGLPGPEVLVEWCRAKGLKVKATTLLSDNSQPLWLRSKNAEETTHLAEAHVRELVGRFKGRVDYWDVATRSWPTVNFQGLRLPVSKVFGWARQADDRAGLLLSHYLSAPLRLAGEEQARQPFGLDGLVFVAYQADGVWPAEELEAQLDTLARPKLPVHLDMVMIPGAPKDEERQARGVEAFYRTAFAQPAVRSIIWWDLSDRFAYHGAPGGLLRKDLTPKPAYLALVRLIRDEWCTGAEGRSGPDGSFAFRGFFGHYRVRANMPNGLAGLWEIDLASAGPREFRLTASPAYDLPSP